MKRCAIFFALLILTIVIAVVSGSDARTMEGVSMDSGNAMARQETGVDLHDTMKD